MSEYVWAQTVKIVVPILVVYLQAKKKKKLKQSKLPFLRYCRFVVSDTLGIDSTSLYTQLNQEYYVEVYLHTKNQNNPACLSKIL